VNRFLVDVSIALYDKPITFEAFFAQNCGSVIVEGISELKRSREESEIRCDYLENALAQLSELFSESSEGEDPLMVVDKVKEVVIYQKRIMDKRAKKLKSIQSLVGSVRQEVENRIRAFDSEEFRLNRKVLELEEALAESKEKLHTETTRNLREFESSASLQHEEALAAMTAEHNRTVNALKAELQTAQKNADSLRAELSECESRLDRHRQLLQAQKASAARQEEVMEGLRKLLGETEAKAKARFDDAKAQLSSTFQNTIDELRNQGEALRADIQRISAALSESEATIVQLKGQCAQWQKEKRRAEGEMRLMDEQLDREKRLCEATLRTRILALESQLSNQLEDAKRVYEAKQRNLFRFVAEAFHGFYNPSESIDEKSFRAVIGQTKRELEKMSLAEQQVRRLLGIGEGRPIQDALAQYLMMRQ
jgi:chromosome segregation ATPase